MTDERLNGPALLFVHPDITLDYTMLLLTNFGNRIVGYSFVSRPRGLLNGTHLEVGPVNIQSSD